MIKFAHLLLSGRKLFCRKSTGRRRWRNALCILVIISMAAVMAAAMTACAFSFPGINNLAANGSIASETSVLTDSISIDAASNDSTSTDSTSPGTSEMTDISAAKIGIYEKEGKAAVLGGDAPHSVDGVIYPGIYDVQYSVDQTQAAFLTDYIEGQGGTLVYASKTQYITIAQNVVSFYLSSDGSTIAYLIGTNTGTKTGTYDAAAGGALYTYSCETKKSAWVADHAGMTMVLSPKGTSIGYSVISKDASANIKVTGYYNAEGAEPQKVGENSFVTALLDDAGIVYILNSDSETYSTCALHDGTYTQYSSCPAYAGGYTCFIFNRDGTEVILNDDMSTYSYSQNAALSQKIIDAMTFGPLGECSF